MLIDNEKFWELLDSLCKTQKIVIDRPHGTRHPKYSQMIYPYDYGYLQGSTATDGCEIDVWMGSLSDQRVCGIISSVDVRKRDAEIKILYACTEEEIQTIFTFHNQNSDMQGILVVRE